MSFTKFPSIEQFRHVIANVKRHATYRGNDEHGNPIHVDEDEAVLPTLHFRGTVKLHGTNAGVGYNKRHGIWAQSRNRVLTAEADNQGFFQFVQQNRAAFETLMAQVDHGEHETVCIFGEWCGQGIQKGVAIATLPKLFVIFAVKIVNNSDGERWLNESALKRLKAADNMIFNVYDYETFDVTVDFNEPDSAVPTLDSITEKVEQRCPVAAVHGAIGIGEGVVWLAHHDTLGPVRFKVKGDQHRVVESKRKSTATNAEHVESLQKFVQYAVTENRLAQGIAVLFTSQNAEPSVQKIGEFLRWVQEDVLKEEADVISKNNLEKKLVLKAIGTAACQWFLQKLNKQ